MTRNIDRWTFHGGCLAEAQAAYPDAPEPWIDLSTGINPHAWPGVASVAIGWRALPEERDLARLEAAAAAWFGVNAVNVCAVPGTEIGLRLVGRMMRGPALRVGPGYRTHAAMQPTAREIPAEALARASAANIILANPNNPDGHVVPAETLDGVLERLAGGRNWLIVDEAFADSMPEISLADRIADSRRLIIFRSFGKFFGLAGVRLGFVLAPRPLLARLRAVLGSWPVCSAALAIGTVAYRDLAWIEAMRLQLDQEAARLDKVLSHHGLTPRGACPLFRLVEVEDATRLFEKLARQGILTRPFDHAPGRVRIGLPGSVEALARLDQALGHG